MKCANNKCDKNPMDSPNVKEILLGLYACDEVCSHAYDLQQLYYWENQIYSNKGTGTLPLDSNKDSNKQVDK